MLEKEIKNLVFEGGGVKGVAYSGAINVLSEKKILEQVEKVAGNSAGAITAGLLALRYSASEIEKIIFDMDFKSFEDDKNYRRVKSEYGLYEGDVFLNWMTGLITDKGLDGKATFADFEKAGCRDLVVFSTDLYTQSLQKFSFEETPDTIVAEAIRASMSIPLFFKAWTFSNKKPNDHIYVDGGVLLNFPIHAFPDDEHTLGLQLENLTETVVVNDFGYKDLKAYTKALFETMLVTQKVAFEQDTDAVARTVNIHDLGISSTNFDITEEEKHALVEEGRKAMELFLE